MSKDLRDGDLIMVRVSSIFVGVYDKKIMLNVLAPSVEGHIPVLISKELQSLGSHYSIDRDGARWGIDTNKYKGKRFVRIRASHILSSTRP